MVVVVVAEVISGRGGGGHKGETKRNRNFKSI